LVALGLKATTAGKAWYVCERIVANWYNNKHVKLFLFLFGPVNLHSDSWILQLKNPNGLWVNKFFVKTGDNDSVFFPRLPIAYYRHDYWPLNCKQCKPNRKKSHRFSLARESLVPVYGMKIFYKPTKNQSTLTLFNQAPQNVETKIKFPRSEFHRQMANKRKERYF
jgi:hypothetical protein